MATRIQVAVDCHDSKLMVDFWSTALHYVMPDPPSPFTRWSEYWRSFDLPEDEIDDHPSMVVDPDGVGPRMFFHEVPEGKVSKNRWHLDLAVSGGRDVPIDVRRERVGAEADRLVAAGATKVRVLEAPNHYAVAMLDPEGNEFDLN